MAVRTEDKLHFSKECRDIQLLILLSLAAFSLLANFRSVISNQNHSTSLESTLQTRLAWVNQPAGQVKEGGRESGDRADGLM